MDQSTKQEWTLVVGKKHKVCFTSTTTIKEPVEPVEKITIKRDGQIRTY
jgi:hypothetical protein